MKHTRNTTEANSACFDPIGIYDQKARLIQRNWKLYRDKKRLYSSRIVIDSELTHNSIYLHQISVSYQLERLIENESSLRVQQKNNSSAFVASCKGLMKFKNKFANKHKCVDKHPKSKFKYYLAPIPQGKINYNEVLTTQNKELRELDIHYKKYSKIVDKVESIRKDNFNKLYSVIR